MNEIGLRLSRELFMQQSLTLELEMFGAAPVGSTWEWLAEPRLWGVLILSFGAAALVFAIGDLIRRDREEGGRAVRLLTKSLGLARAERRLLLELSRHGGAASAACLLLSRGWFDHASAMARARGCPVRTAQIERLRRRLFAEQPETAEAAGRRERTAR